MKQGRLIIISGPSGAGKSTIVRAVMAQSPGAFFSVSATTRAIRTGEQDGVDYLFVSRERFQDMIRNDGLLEWAEYVDNYYGTPAEPVRRKLAEGCDVILDIETRGAEQVMAKYPEAISIFVCAPSFAEIEERLRKRGTNTEADIQKRLAKGRAECEKADMYTYLIINDDREKAAAQTEAILIAESCKSKEHLKVLKGE